MILMITLDLDKNLENTQISLSHFVTISVKSSQNFLLLFQTGIL